MQLSLRLLIVLLSGAHHVAAAAAAAVNCRAVDFVVSLMKANNEADRFCSKLLERSPVSDFIISKPVPIRGSLSFYRQISGALEIMFLVQHIKEFGFDSA